MSPETSERRLATMVEVARKLTSQLDLPAVLATVSEAAVEVFHAEVGFRLIEGDELVLRGGTPGARQKMVRERLKVGESISGRVAATGEPIVTGDVPSDPRAIVEHRVADPTARTDALMCVPIRGGSRVLGTLNVYGERGRRFDDADLRLATSLADQAGVALENARLYSESVEQRRSLTTLVEMTRRLTRGLDLVTVLGSIAAAAANLFKGDAGFRLLEGDSLVRVAATEGALGAMARERVRVGETFSGEVALTGNAVVASDTSADPRRLSDHQASLVPARAGALMCVPIKLDDRILGTLNVYRERGFHFDDDAVRLATSFADQAAIAIENARLYQAVKHAYEELSRAQEQLVRGETLRALGGLAAGAAHHLNNRLAIIVGRVQLMRMPGRAPEKLQRSLEIVERAAQDIADVVRGLGAFGHAPATSDAEAVDLNDLVRDVLALARPHWRDERDLHDMTTEVVVESGDIPLIAADAAALRQALLNLTLNAVDAMPAGGRLVVRTWEDAAGVHCSVSDTGAGMSPAVQRRALEPFFTTKGVKSVGLGLSVSYGIVRRHGGDLTVDTAEGHGTTVTFHIPVRPLSSRSVSSPPAPPTPLRVLLIDDEAEVREVIADMLSAQGHTVMQEGGGESGLRRLDAEWPVDVVLTDLGMPGMTGWNVAEAVKARHPEMPVGLVTGWAEAITAEQEQRTIVDFVLAKPLTADDLRTAMGRLRRKAR